MPRPHRHHAGTLTLATALALTTCATLTGPAQAHPHASPHSPQAAHTPHASHGPRDPARQTLPADDGWASEGTGTTGGAKAEAQHVHTVRTWDEFRTALAAGGTAPKIIKVAGTLNATASGCSAFESPGYDFGRYLAAYDPAVWGYENPVSGPLEDARAASATLQAKAIKAPVPANTTIIGIGRNAGITGGSLQIQGVDNVIIRNLTVESPLDCFPQWDPTDGAKGAWNSEYDAMVVHSSTHVWIDHNTFTDGAHPDSSLPRHYGELYQQHDGELDIVRGANHVTASWNTFADHDKTLMIGNSDGASGTDAGKLKVTLHHNHFTGIVERAPRVRFGQVDAYNNHFTVTSTQPYEYAFGIGQDSRLYAEKNTFTLPPGVAPARILKKWKDAPLTDTANYVNGRPTDLIAAHNAANPTNPLRRDAGWTPTLRSRVDHPKAVPGLVRAQAGAGRLR
ncbi:polysaccharide lyase family 1 protein [Streptomyces sp. NPDC058657]|uniref:pectate lyase family protein n=1 Tax=unclassified Streptomyces TaxID=2593676 RepID=UPI00366047B7